MIAFIDWSLLTEDEKLDFIRKHTPAQMVEYIHSIQKQKRGISDRLDMALAEIELLKEQIRKMPYLFGSEHNEKKGIGVHP